MRARSRQGSATGTAMARREPTPGVGVRALPRVTYPTRAGNIEIDQNGPTARLGRGSDEARQQYDQALAHSWGWSVS